MPRKHERVPFLAEIILHSASGKRTVRISDLSRGGCYVDTISTMADGETVSFELVHPNGERLSFNGEVCYSFEGQGFGLKFTDLGDDQKKFLERVLPASTG